MSRVRGFAVAAVLATLRILLRVLGTLIPQSASVVVSGYPESEGNAVEVARALLRRYPGRVVWLREAGPPPAEVVELAGQGLVLVPKASPRGLWAYLRAQTVMFTHGLYGCPRPTARRPVVNLWHGDGPKDVRPGRGIGAMIRSTYFVGSTRLFSEHQAGGFDVPPENLIITGNPRTDQLWRPVEPARLRSLGITGDFVVWMPTFRRTRAVGAMGAHSELGGRGADDRVHLDALVEGLGARGLQLVIKPHPMDADGRVRDGALTVTDAELAAAQVSLYGLLGQSRGLVTDYSSVWVDYLLTDRPMAFLVADRAHYTRNLIPPDVLDWVPGEVVGEVPTFGEFFADLDAQGRRGSSQRAQVAERIGLNPTRSAADDLLSALDERGALGLSRGETAVSLS